MFHFLLKFYADGKSDAGRNLFIQLKDTDFNVCVYPSFIKPERTSVFDEKQFLMNIRPYFEVLLCKFSTKYLKAMSSLRHAEQQTRTGLPWRTDSSQL